MDRGYDYKKYLVLFVDDEEQALKYFARAFWKDFEIVTAPSAEQAQEILREQGERVGVVITDQRMPGESGVDLLTKVRQTRPEIVRIITTAYADLDSAIESVNDGAVFRYVTKPWNIRELRGVLLRAMEFFLIQRERDELLREKLSVLQRMIVLDRVRSFTVLAASLACRVRNTMAALKAFFDLVPANAGVAAAGAYEWETTEDLWTLVGHESRKIVEAVDELLRDVDPQYTYTEGVDLNAVIRQQADLIQPSLVGEMVTLEVAPGAGVASIKADVKMIRRLIDILIRRLAGLAGQGQRVRMATESEASVFGAPGARVRMTASGPAWSNEQLMSLFTAIQPSVGSREPLGIDFLAAFFIAYHHGGDLRVHPAPPQGPGFELLLPCNPEASRQPPVEADWLNRIFTHLEAWNQIHAAPSEGNGWDFV